jgi:hypothetical protein
MNSWKTGAFARLPWSGFAALLGAVVGMAGSIAILIASNGVPITKWSIQPTVYLSITSTITNILIHYALSEGLTTAWWSRALNSNVKVADLHRNWKSGNSLLSAVTSGRHFNLIALAAIFVAISPVNGPFLQRASHVVISQTITNTQLLVQIAKEIPQGYTAWIEGREETPAFFSEDFTPVVSDLYDRSDISIKDTGCAGNCSAGIIGAGFAISCSAYQAAFDLRPYNNPDGTFNTSQPNVAFGVQVFQSFFFFDSRTPQELQLNIQYKPKTGCDGSLIVKNCTLSLATVEYSAFINGNGSSISLPATSTIYDDVLVDTYTAPVENISGAKSTLGGVYLALNNRFTSWANMRFAGAIGYEVLTSGPTANQFVTPNSVANAEYRDCGLTFVDPTDFLVANARELMFRTAIAAANSSTVQVVDAFEVAPITVYQSDFLYLALASVFTFLAIILVLPTFYGYWNLGRSVSMSPVEIAKAFNASLLWNNDSNANAKGLVDELGYLDVRYGAVNTGYLPVNGTAGDGMNGEHMTQGHLPGVRLEIAPSDRVTTPEEGWIFRGA